MQYHNYSILEMIPKITLLFHYVFARQHFSESLDLTSLTSAEYETQKLSDLLLYNVEYEREIKNIVEDFGLLFWYNQNADRLGCTVSKNGFF